MALINNVWMEPCLSAYVVPICTFQDLSFQEWHKSPSDAVWQPSEYLSQSRICCLKSFLTLWYMSMPRACCAELLCTVGHQQVGTLLCFPDFLYPPLRLFSVTCRHTLKHVILCLWQTEQWMQNAEQDFFLLYQWCFSRIKQGSSRPAALLCCKGCWRLHCPAAAQHASSLFQRNQHSPQKLHLAVDVVPP